MDIPGYLWYGEKNTKGGLAMKKTTAILALITLLTSCGHTTDIHESPPTKIETSTVSAEEKEVGAEVITTTSTALTTAKTTVTITGTQPTTAEMQETAAVSVTEIVTVADTAEIQITVQSSDTIITPKPVTSTAEQTPPQTTTKATQRFASPETTVLVTESPTEQPTEAHAESPAEPTEVQTNDVTDYEKAVTVYEYIQQNGSGTCVNYACQTYEKCHDIGLGCYIVWTGAGLYGHVANIVNVDGVWYVMDVQGERFLDYNYSFTEVVNEDGDHIADSDIISSYSYSELH
jgi:outer membrane lipopolysaccharide assembly protein LptE/RlpB